MESSFSKIDNYIIELCENHDHQKTGLIHFEKFIKCLKESKRIQLFSLELCIIRGFLDVDDENMV